MLLPLSLLFVGAVLMLNGLWMMNRVADQDIVVVNLSTAFITGAVALLSMIGADTAATVKAAALTFLFSLTYLWVGMNRMNGSDGRGLGWFSFFVAISVLPEAVVTLRDATGMLDLWLGLCWACWAVLWFLNFLVLVPRWPLAGITAGATVAGGIFTAWMPALVMLYGSA